MDVDSDGSVKTAIADILKDAGHIDVLVNNAGVERNGSVEELALADFRAVMETNYFGALRCIHAVVPQMRQRKSGCIINVSSVVSKTPATGGSVYSATKGAVDVISRSLAQELGPRKIRVNTLAPGATDTEGVRSLAGGIADFNPAIGRKRPRPFVLPGPGQKR